MSITASEGVRQRLLAYILPRRPETAEQETAMTNAVEVQLAYENDHAYSDVPGNVSSYKNDGLSVTFVQGRRAAIYSDDTLSPVAWSILRNAGLIVHDWPTARRP